MSRSETELPGLKDECLQVRWHPVEEGRLKATLCVCVNGGYSRDIVFRGESVPLNVVPSIRQLRFGNVSPGARRSQRMELHNRSSLPVHLSFKPAMELFERHRLQLQSPSTLYLGGRASAEVVIVFAPLRRQDAFDEACCVAVEGTPMALFRIRGESRASDLYLSPVSIDFGTVADGSTKTEYLRLTNDGTENAVLRWHSTHTAFRVVPEEGVIGPGQKGSYAVSFRPMNVSSLPIVAAISCTTESENSQCGCLSVKGVIFLVGDQCELTAEGRCVPCPVHEEILRFSCPPGERTSQNVAVRNPTTDRWNDIQVQISNTAWSLTQRHEIPPQESRDFEIVFSPSREQRGETKAILWMQFPDGQGQKFTLVGHIEPDVERRSLQRVIPLRTTHTEEIPIRNNTPVKQRFEVDIQRGSCPESVFIQVTPLFSLFQKAQTM